MIILIGYFIEIYRIIEWNTDMNMKQEYEIEYRINPGMQNQVNTILL